MSGEFDSRKDSQSIKFEPRPRILVNLRFREFRQKMRFKKKKKCMHVYLLNVCKLDLKENLFDFYVESIAFRVQIYMNVTSI